MSQIGEAFVRVRPLATGFGPELDRQAGPGLRRFERQLAGTNRELGRFSRGALVGTGALGGLGRAAAFASTSFIGGAGLIFGIKSTIKAAMESQVVLGQTENAVKRAGLSWETYGDQIQKVALAQAQLSGFDDERLLGTFSTLVRRTGDVNEALKLNALAANIARGRNIELEQATQLVLKATLGMGGALRRLGIDAPKAATSLQLIQLLSEKYAGSAAKFADTAAGAQARFNVALQNTQETIGTALLPAITRYLDKGTAWLNQEGNQERIQRDVNQAVETGAAVLGGLADALKVAKDIAEPLVDTVGGLKNAVELLLLVMAVRKVTAFATALGLVGPAAIKAGAGIATAEREIAAARILGGRGALAALGPLGLAVGGGYALGQIFDKNNYTTSDLYKTVGKGGPAGELASKVIAKVGLPGALRFMDVFPALKAGVLTVTAVMALKDRFVNDSDYQAAMAYARQMELAKKADTAAVAAAAGHAKPDPIGAGTTGPLPVTQPTGLDALTPRGRNQLALTSAAGTSSTADDLRALVEQRRLLGRAIETETGRLNNAVGRKQVQKFADNLQDLKDQDNIALAQIQGIQEQAAQDAQDKAAKITAASEKARVEKEKALSAARNAREKARSAEEKAARASQKLIRGEVLSVLGGVELGVDVKGLSKAREARLKAFAVARRTAQEIQEGALGIARQVADLAVARAGGDEKLLGKAEAAERRADQRLIAFYKKRIAETRGLERQGYREKLIAAQLDLAGLKKEKAKATTGYTLDELFAEAGNQEALYGSNIGGGDTPLSAQEAHGKFGGIVKTHQTVVVQNFYGPTRPNQAMNDARSSARNLK